MSKRIFIHDALSRLKGEDSLRDQRTTNSKLFQRKNKINMHITANSGQAILFVPER
jgi:hypothetical protein